MTIPPLREYDSLEDWVTDVAEAIGQPTDTVWNIVDEIKPGAGAVARNSKAQLLQRLFKHHTLYMKKHLKQKGSPANSCWIKLYTDDRLVYQFYWPTHTPIVSDSNRELVHEIIEEEGMEFQQKGKRFIAAFLPESGIDENIRIVTRILDEVHNVSIDELDRAIEFRKKKQFSWTDQERLAENIERVEVTSDQNEDKQETDEEQVDDWLSSQTKTEKEYGDWIFCQSCGNRISDPDNNPRFCSECRD